MEKKQIKARLQQLLEELYGSEVAPLCERLLARADQVRIDNKDAGWSEKDQVLISYGDSVIEDGIAPLVSLHGFIRERLLGLISSVHILPFFPYSSDDGFSVIDYRAVNPELGDWHDITAISADVELMADLVINHVSSESDWFKQWVNNQAPGNRYFIELPGETDVSQVTRPRNAPLLVPVDTERGVRHLWATFSPDQIDLNFANPEVLEQFVDIMLLYVERGARIIRLDAIAFLWKELGTKCVHLPQTHKLVKVLRLILQWVGDHCWLLTETNVPQEANLSYFGQGDEAQLVYQFPLPPLLLHSLQQGTSSCLKAWLKALPQLPKGCTWLNFTASHDGIGLRAAEGLLPEQAIQALVDHTQQCGGFVSMRATSAGPQPYELNISWFNALTATSQGPDQWYVERFLCSQLIMLSLQGIPALYIHSLTATPSDLASVDRTGRMRSINRHRWIRSSLEALLNCEATPQAKIFSALTHYLGVRSQWPAFHPDSPQEVLDSYESMLVLRRGNKQFGSILILANLISSPRTLPADLGLEADECYGQELLSGETTTELGPYQVKWLSIIKKDVET